MILSFHFQIKWCTQVPIVQGFSSQIQGFIKVVGSIKVSGKDQQGVDSERPQILVLKEKKCLDHVFGYYVGQSINARLISVGSSNACFNGPSRHSLLTWPGAFIWYSLKSIATCHSHNIRASLFWLIKCFLNHFNLRMY